MWEIVLKSLVLVLAAYALIDLSKKLICALFRKRPYLRDDVFVVVKVKNHQEHIEGIVRSIIWRNLSMSGGGFVPNILIVDMGSSDETAQVAERLCKDYGFIYYTTEEKYNQMKDTYFTL